MAVNTDTLTRGDVVYYEGVAHEVESVDKGGPYREPSVAIGSTVADERIPGHGRRIHVAVMDVHPDKLEAMSDNAMCL